MKLAIICSSYPPYVKGGGEISTQLLAESLLRKGEDVFVIAASDKNKVEKVNGVKVYRIDSPNLYWSYHSGEKNVLEKTIWHLNESYNVFAKNRLLPILEQEKPSVLHSSTIEDWSPAVWKVAYDSGIKVVHTLRSYSLLCPRATMFRNGDNCNNQCLDCKVMGTPKKMYSQYVNNVVGISEFILNEHLLYDFFKNAKRTIIHNQVNSHRSDHTYSGSTLFNEKQVVRFGFIGRLHITKGINSLITCFSESDLKNKSRLIIAGKGPLETEITSIADRFSSITYLGYVEPDTFFDQVDVLIVPSQWNEPFGRVIIESFQHNVPVIASNVGGISELVTQGINGFLYNPDDHEDLMNKMKSFSTNREQLIDLRKRLNEFDSSVYSSDNIADEYLKVYLS